MVDFVYSTQMDPIIAFVLYFVLIIFSRYFGRLETKPKQEAGS